MQNITIADINIKTGTGEKGDWVNTQITDEAGARYSSFDTKLSKLNKGAVIEAEIEVKGKYLNIKSWNLISEGSPPSASGNGPDQMSKEDWAMKAALERISIERQNATTNVCNLIIAGKVGIDDALGKKVLNYLANKLSGVTSSATQPAPTTSPAPTTKKQVDKDVDELWPKDDKITTDQKIELNKLVKKQGINIGEFLDGKGWTEKYISDLSVDQAQVLIDELTTPKERT